MKYKKMTPHELTLRTVEDMNRRKKAESEGRKQAIIHCVENRRRIQKRLGYGRY